METNKTRRTKSSRQAARKTTRQTSAAEHPDFLTESIPAPTAIGPAAPRVQKRTLGERIREARELRGLTLEDLSSRSGIPVDGLERIESNRATPPLGQLVRLGKALEMKMGYLLSAGVDKPMCVVRADSRPKVARHGKQLSEQYGYVYESLAPEKANRQMEPFLVTMMPTEFGEFSTHDGQEFIFVLEGEIRAQVGKDIETLRPGDSIYYDSAQPHLVKCYGEKPAKIIAVIYAGTK